jgi:hypothetical protein
MVFYPASGRKICSKSSIFRINNKPQAVNNKGENGAQRGKLELRVL